MMYPFMTLNDGTEIVHSEMKPDGRVKVYIEKPDEKFVFRHATCWLPTYTWEDVFQFSDSDILAGGRNIEFIKCKNRPVLEHRTASHRSSLAGLLRKDITQT